MAAWIFMQRAAVAPRLLAGLAAVRRGAVMRWGGLIINLIVADMEEMLRRLLGEDIDLHVHRQPNLGYTRADRSQLQQVLVNLVVNARDVMPHGGKLSIETKSARLEFCMRV